VASAHVAPPSPISLTSRNLQGPLSRAASGSRMSWPVCARAGCPCCDRGPLKVTADVVHRSEAFGSTDVSGMRNALRFSRGFFGAPCALLFTMRWAHAHQLEFPQADNHAESHPARKVGRRGAVVILKMRRSARLTPFEPYRHLTSNIPKS
jgi:hypothetical protein